MKSDHVAFDEDGHLTRYDFGQIFSKATNFDPIHKLCFEYAASDFEALPLLANWPKYKPSNFVFNRCNGQISAPWRELGNELRISLGAGFKQDVYTAILKILLMPDFLTDEINKILHSTPLLKERILRSTGSNPANLYRKQLLSCMQSSTGFIQFLKTKGHMARQFILNDILGFRSNNSYFKKNIMKLNSRVAVRVN